MNELDQLLSVAPGWGHGSSPTRLTNPTDTGGSINRTPGYGTWFYIPFADIDKVQTGFATRGDAVDAAVDDAISQLPLYTEGA